MKAFSHINIGEKISFIIGCKNYRILVVSKKTDKPCANCTRTCAICTSFNFWLQALSIDINSSSIDMYLAWYRVAISIPGMIFFKI